MRYHRASLRVRPRWQTLLLALAGLLASFLLPPMLLCGHVSQTGILWAMVGTIFLTGVGYLWAGWRVQAQCFEHRRVDDLLLGGILLLAAACLLLQLAVQTGPMAARSLAFWPSAATVLVSVLAGTFLMHWRALRLARSAPDRAG
jgi:cation transport ATPase